MNAVAGLVSVGLEALDAQAALQTRVDRKYVVPLSATDGILAELTATEPATAVLEIAGARSFGYESVYFDTPDLDSYHLTVRRRRRRFKVRTRAYLETGGCWLEVKTRGARGTTVKQRTACGADDRRRLTAHGRDFVAAVLHDAGVAPVPVDELAPTLVTRYRRTTLLLGGATASRATIDTGLGWSLDDPARTTAGVDGLAVVETKTGSAASALDRVLWSRGHRPVRISKFGSGLATLRPELPSTPWNRVISRYLDPATAVDAARATPAQR
ncbi:polyphosphate polymerase domain-containing protein [Cellulomonas sp. PhB143]|uniref:polyphosphate polymerase domain-containing protein n=1 Tax=Cellulomonas sp. PhB143 TaxID=2485186 RepID=UPI000F46FBAE|nr:polyphosphate polymerase domain-containing protein [Cellulomonas sp. PhB143]ROS79062.1 VTC domain-containing protein [Cellulomonas sp. PhB143]